MIRHISHWATGFSLHAMVLACMAASPAHAQLLDRAGEHVKRFWDHMSSVACTESLLQEKLDEKGKVVLNSRGNFDYLMSLRWDNEGMLLDESRLATDQGRKKAPQGVLLTTQGFAALLMILHPQFQPGYSFEAPVEDLVQNKRLARVRFTARNGVASPSVLNVKGRSYPITWEGSAWLDPETGQPLRIEAHWKEVPEELGLEMLSSDVTYVPIAFSKQPEPYWLPLRALVEVKTHHQHWRNTHEFSKHRLFSVDAESTIEAPPKPDNAATGNAADPNADTPAKGKAKK